MTAALVSVTGNGSHTEASAVTRNECGKCETALAPWDWHCRTCHADDHCACAWCSGCMPTRHRHDRRYCSSTCRVRALQWRRSPEGQAALREAEQRQRQWWESPNGQMVTALTATLPTSRVDEQQQARWEHAFKTGEICAHCGRELGAGPVYWTAANTGRETENYDPERRAAPACADCATPKHGCVARLCEHCRPLGGRWLWSNGGGSVYVRRWGCRESGPGHRKLYCDQCHPRNWKAVRCPGCERTVMFRAHGNRPTRVPGPDDTYEASSTAFCSQRCRTRVDHDRAVTRRLEAHAEQAPHQCAGCTEVLDGKRADAIYCSGACRQRAYRQRGGQP